MNIKLQHTNNISNQFFSTQDEEGDPTEVLETPTDAYEILGFQKDVEHVSENDTIVEQAIENQTSDEGDGGGKIRFIFVAFQCRYKHIIFTKFKNKTMV